MKRVLTAIVGLLLVAAAAAVAHFHVAAQEYYPVVRISAPEGLSYLAVMDPQHERQACGAANNRFLEPIKLMCPGCRIVYARCERELPELEAKVYDGTPIPHPEVDARGFRMVIIGEAKAAQTTCEFVAGYMIKQGIRSATCVRPNRPPPPR